MTRLSRIERGRHLTLHVSVEDRHDIETRAASARLSVSGYLRATALGRGERKAPNVVLVTTLAEIDGELAGLTQALRASEGREQQSKIGERIDALRVRLSAAAAEL